MGRNGGSCYDGNPFIELSSFVTLGPGRYKHRLKLAKGPSSWSLGRVLAKVLEMSTWKVPGTRTSPERTRVWTQAKLRGQGVKVVQVRTKLELHVCATGVYIG